MNQPIKILTVLGARPQFIKAATVSRAIKDDKQVVEKIFHSGQHYDFNMSDIFFHQMDIPKPDYKHSVNGRTHAKMTAEIMIALENIVTEEKFDFIMVYGDTNTTLAGAMVAAKQHIPLIHVESGLRSFNKKMPEEVNRVLTDHVADILFVPTEEAERNLKSEGITHGVHLVGDVMYDATLFYKSAMKKPANLESKGEFYLCTIHRQENTDDTEKLKNIIAALREVSLSTPVILPLHPRTKNAIQSLNIDTGDITIIDPMGYFEILYLLEHCKGVITDSGGLQKESYFFHKPSLILREETEWVELVENQVAILVGSDTKRILEGFTKLHNGVVFPPNLYGSGDASHKIVNILKKG